MSADLQDLLRVCERLPGEKRVEVVDFARFLLSQEGDERWEAIIADPTPRPKLEEFFRRAKAEGSEPLDLDRL